MTLTVTAVCAVGAALQVVEKRYRNEKGGVLILRLNDVAFSGSGELDSSD
jgi:hypothetical protein